MVIRKREHLALMRRKSLMSQQEVAMNIGISQAQYSNIENGYSVPCAQVAEKLIDMFNLNSDYFDPPSEEE